MTNEHTPKLSTISFNPVPQMGYYNIEDDQGGIIGRVVSSARAAQMVRACNAHDDLINALSGLVEFLENYAHQILDSQGRSLKEDLGGYSDCYTALAKARGE